MKISTSIPAAVALLASTVSAAIANASPVKDVTFQLNIPDTTASSGKGDIFFAISAPTTYTYVSLGQGSEMANSNMFVIYTSADGMNVTLSSRLGTGHDMPMHDTTADVTLLAGSGVSNGLMTANVRCGNCNSWSGGTMDFTASSSNWIYAIQSGKALNSDDPAANIDVHDSASNFKWALSNAKGGDDANPFVNSNAAATPAVSGMSTATSTMAVSCTPVASGQSSDGSTSVGDSDGNGYRKRQSSNPCAPGYAPVAVTSDGASNAASGSSNGDATFLADSDMFGSLSAEASHAVLIAHGVLASLTFLLILPVGALLIRLASFPSLLFLHGALQLLGLFVYLAAFGLGIFMALQLSQVNYTHPIIGIVLLVLLLIQPLSGLLHHRLFAKSGHRQIWSWLHLSFGRIAILLGLVNGGLGLVLADTSRTAKITYTVIATIVGLTYVAGIIAGEIMRKRTRGAVAAAVTSATGSQRRYPDKGIAESGRSSGSTTRPPMGILRPTSPPEYYTQRRAWDGEAERPYTGT